MTPALPNGPVGRVLAACLTLLLLAAVWLGIVLPLLGWYAGRAGTLVEREALVSRQAALAAELPALEQAGRRASRVAPAEDAFLAGATDAIAGATLEQLLQTMANQTGATLSSAEALAPQADGHYRLVQLRVTESGDWGSLVGLLRAVTGGRPAMLVDNLQVSAAQDVQTGVPPISATFTVIAFRNGNVHPGNTEPGTSSTMAP